MAQSPEPADVEQTEVGSYFVANYPPFSVWTPQAVAADARPALETVPADGVPLGLYLHIPFCRKRCHFCYFRVYTDRNAQEVESYLDLLAREWELYAPTPAIAGRPIDFVYFGGGTPSFLSTAQLERLVDAADGGDALGERRRDHVRVRAGHADRSRSSRRSASMGVTRLSLGVENFDDRILELNGRAHRSPEIGRAYAFARVARISRRSTSI